MINKEYPKASRFVEWALKRSKETFDSSPVEYKGKLYQATYRAWSGSIGGKAAVIYGEVGSGRLYLVNDEYRQVWVENAARYVSEYGALRVGEAVFTLAKCGRCHCELSDIPSAELNACEDCIDAVSSDPELAIEEWVRGKWGE